MLNYNMERITKGIIKELESLEFVQKPNFKNYDYVSVSEHYLELYAEEVREPVAVGENLEYKVIKEADMRRFQNKNFDGVFVEY